MEPTNLRQSRREMSSKQGDTTRQSLLTAEQREYLREHQVTKLQGSRCVLLLQALRSESITTSSQYCLHVALLSAYATRFPR